MEELTNVIETTGEVMDSNEIVEVFNEEVIGSNKTAFAVVAIGAAIAGGIYGFKKLKKWRQSKNEIREQITEVEDTVKEEVTNDTEENI